MAPRKKALNAVHIAVIGGGPKAASLVAKAEILRTIGLADIRVTVFEAVRPGANWVGGFGYSDGKQPLCTPAERDIGFPYRSRIAETVDVPLSARFGWTAFKMAKGLYAKWVDDGRHPPLHRDFADYIRWIFETAHCDPVIGEVTQLRPTADKKRWEVEYQLGGLPTRHATLFDAAVITGPGPAKHVPSTGIVPDGSLYDGSTFWLHTQAIKEKLLAEKPEDRYVVIIGGGGTSAAIVAWLARNGFGDNRIDIIASQPIYSRIDSHFENRYFSDDESWKQLSPTQRIALHERLNRGVVWTAMLGDLGNATGLNIVHGYVDGIEAGHNGELFVMARRWNNERPPLSSSLVIDASGFDPWWFRKLFSGSSRDGRWDGPDREALFATIEPSLRFGPAEWKLPPLHVPGLSQAQGAGLASLMSLGAMSDLILGQYVAS